MGSAPSSTRLRFDCTMSGGAAVEIRATLRWLSSRASSNSRARSSSAARGRSRPAPPKGASAGFAPRNVGLGATMESPSMV